MVSVWQSRQSGRLRDEVKGYLWGQRSPRGKDCSAPTSIIITTLPGERDD